ncbi:hypothetical protein EUTSA_v10029417mg [Eutrema salsugineum]|uniref:F-box associated domain-containing protein n=1 Tax=Eutrema salsugineum TaxID=72664 RepID=V4MZS3_EUTSA|nr:hypothetical protein EUTSA_v10029417mg [Eutrema salsugineum]
MMKGNAILDIISHCSSTEIGKFRLLNKACNKSTYQFFFISRHLRGTNSVFGYLIQSYERFKYRSSFVSFLPSRDVKIKAWDTHHGILLCVDNAKFKGGRRIPDYIICKPAMKQYRIIPNPKTRYFTIATGLVVIQSNPFWYKIVRVFDSDSIAWKRLNDLELSMDEFFWSSNQPVSFYVSYEGKTGVIHTISREEYDLWVLYNSFEKSWVHVKDVSITGLEDKYVTPLWFPGNDVVSVVGFCRLGLYNMNNNKCLYMKKTQDSLPYYFPSGVCFPFYTNYERVCLNDDRVARSNGCDED